VKDGAGLKIKVSNEILAVNRMERTDNSIGCCNRELSCCP